MKYFVRISVLFVSLTFVLSEENAQGAGLTSIAELKPGHRFEILEKLSFPVPPMFRILRELPLLQVTEKTIAVLQQSKTTEPVCVITGITLNAAIPPQVEFPKGSTVEVKNVEAGQRVDSLYTGQSTVFGIKATHAPIQANLRCYPGKDVKGSMKLEALQKIFRNKIKFKK